MTAKRPRKMLGSLDDPAVVHLQQVIPTQSVEVLFAWATDTAAARCLSLWRVRRPDDRRADVLARTALDLRAGKATKKQLKADIKTMRDAARELDGAAVEVACARALSTAAAVATTPTNALEFVFYLAAAVAYDELGTDADQQALDRAASQAIAEAAAALDEVAVADEPHPSRVDFSC